MPTTIWNISDLSNITLDASALIATATAQGAVRAVIGSTSGKYYFEFSLNQFSSGNSGVGIANASAVLSSVGPTPTNACLVYPSGNVWLNNAFSGKTIGGITAGSVVCVALDLSLYQIWLRVGASGNWNGSATNDPATGVGGIALAAIASASVAVFPIFAGGASGEKATALFGDSAHFFGVVPSGFTAGYPVAGSPGPTVVQMTQMAVEQWSTVNPAGQLTQIAIEHWNTVNPTGLMTQIAIEQWASVVGAGFFSARHV